ncbi:uncharacterized protein F4812DRAFT_462040 [Daldinia caldariorum]|uniref:uncharacterized protein n=1 Tax=Daldinia caldariorum TaxID=326644 RepID=UPI002007C066|nr:uncharacterized protein F4812DRAFT_462040 [Daldinia caldariorum]KAI1465196.1 hypothetical protein F4812DRAFT_462040 [Daldinia caldariorum]
MSGLNDFLVLIPDNPGTAEMRLSNVQAHIAHLKSLVDTGVVVMSGPTLSSHPAAEEEPLAVNGSSVLVRARTESEVRGYIRDDIYAQNGVWDLEKVTITPIKCVVRKPL